MIEYTPTKQQQLLGLAYQMTGEITPSQDICQEVWIRYWKRAKKVQITHPMAYLRRMVINASLDYLQAVAQERAAYKGPWLPEPLLDAPSHSHLDLTYGLTVLLSRLNPKERAIFLLKECFDYSYTEIATTLALTGANCRKIYQRLQVKIKQAAPNNAPSGDTSLFEEHFLEANQTGQLEALIALLKEDIAVYSDGGGKVTAALKSLHGWATCKAFLQGIVKKAGEKMAVQPIWIHQQLGWEIYENNQLTTLVLCDWNGDKVQNLYFIRNPDKLPIELLEK
ncbi:MAG: sigma-70 family RNA polymerase sigma factor [Aureispira sp.]